MKHKINYEDYEDYIATDLLASAVGCGENKHLYLYHKLQEVLTYFVIKDNVKKVTYELYDFADAVKKYNEI